MASGPWRCFAAGLAVWAAMVASAGPSAAYRDGAPWGAAFPDTDETCASCHFESPPVERAAAITVDGLPQTVEPGRAYSLAIRFAPAKEDTPDAVVAGFLAGVRADTGQAGAFLPPKDGDALDIDGAQVRSTGPKPGFPVTWSVTWRAPDTVPSGSDAAPLFLYVAVMASNDDESPFGDRVHYRVFQTALGVAE